MKQFSKIMYCVLLLTIIVMTQSFVSCEVRASEATALPLDIEIEAVFNGNTKENSPFPLKMTVHNPGAALSGELVIEIAGRNTSGNFAYAKAVHLPSNSTEVIWLALPGMSYNNKNNQIVFYKNKMSDGEIVPFNQGNVFVNTTVIPNFTTQVGILSSDDQTLNFLNLMNENSLHFNLIHLDEHSLPDEAYLLQALDYIVINDFAASALTHEQVEAIKAWVQQGGHLILAGGSAYEKAALPFSDITPIQVESTRLLDELTAFEHIAERELVLTKPLEVTTGRLIDGRHIVAEHNMPIIAERNIQRGSVIYVAYDLALDPLASWGGNLTVWDRVFNYDAIVSNQPMLELWRVNQVLDYFSELVPPALGLLLLLFIGYILLVAPALYYVLKKRDKREWAWVVVPVIAIVTSIAIFAFGAAERSNTLAQTLSIIDISEDGNGVKTSFTSVFVPRGGVYAVELAEGMQGSVLSSSLHGRNELNGQYEQVLFMNEDVQSMEFREVPYWTTRQFAAFDRSARHYGQLSYDLDFDDAGIRGEVTNLTDVHLKHVIFMRGNQYVRVGDLSPGATASFALNFSTTPNMTGHYYRSNHPDHLNYEQMTRHEEALMTDVLDRMYRPDMNDDMYIMALSEHADETITVAKRAVPNKQTTLWRMHVEHKAEGGLGDD